MWGRVDFLPRSNGKRWKNKEDVYATGWDDGCDGEGPNDSAAGVGSKGDGAEGRGWAVSVLSGGWSDGGEGEWGGGVFNREEMVDYILWMLSIV